MKKKARRSMLTGQNKSHLHWYVAAGLKLGVKVRYLSKPKPNPNAVWHEVVSLGKIVEVRAPSGFTSGITYSTQHMWEVEVESARPLGHPVGHVDGVVETQ